MSDILDYGKEDVLKFIQSTIKNNNNVKHDILDKIKYVLGEVIEGDVIEDYSSQGFYYERLWDLCIKFGATNLTLPAIKGKLQTSHIINENPNKMSIEFQLNCWDGNKLDKNPGGYVLQPVRSGNSGGYSDITFLNQKYDDKGNKIGGEELYLISVKYFKEEKEISEYDIGKLCSLIREHEKKNRIIKLYIFVRDKKNAIDKFKAQHSSSNILIKYINPGGNYEHIYDINDLQEAFFKLKKILEQYDYLLSPNNIHDFQSNYLNVLKDVFIPRFHQELFILKINKLIEHGEKNVLVGAIPRSGKSYIMAGTILEYVKKQEELHPGKKVKFLLITPAPNETFGEYETIFNKYIEFDKLGIDVVTYKDGVNSTKVCKNKDKHCVIIISKQKLGWTAGSSAEKILAKEDEEGDEEGDEEDDEDDKDDKDIKTIKQRVIKLFDANPDIDIMFLDEAHFGMSTEKAQQIVKALDSAISNTIKIYVTATYNKPLQAYGVKSDCKLTWDMNDIQIMQKIDEKTITDNSIQKQFGNDIYVKSLEYFGDKTGLSLIDKFKKDYSIFPKPYLITSVWDKEFLNVEKLKIGDTEFGWDMNKLFATEGDSDNFANEEQIKEMMRYYFGYPDKDEKYDKQTFYRTRGILPRIRTICLNKCRTLQPQHKTTQLWFLPLGNGKIKNKTKALVNLLTNSNEFNDVKRNYHFFIAVDIEDKTKKGRTMNGVTYMGNPHNIKTDIEEVEKAIKDGKIKKDNLIILAGQRLQLGISLRNVDIVTLWNSISSADAIFQMLFRSMTEVDVPPCKPNEYCAEKKFGFMVDMNPQRALTNVGLFSANISKKKDADDIQKYRQITDLINIDEDVLYDKYGDDEKSRNDFVKDLFNKLYASWDINVENIKKIIGKFTFDMTKLEALKKAFERINIEKGKTMKDEIDKKEEDELIDPGKNKEKTGQTKKKDKPEIKEKEINLIETATELISEFISLLNIFTLYADKGAQCILSDSSKSNAQITLIDDIDVLKSSVYQDEETKDVFLKILNGRLSGKADEPYPENVIDDVLDAMDSLDDKLIVNKIIMSQKKQYYTINEPDKLLEFINSELKPKEKEKKENGEVFTPLSLVNEMLDKLDEAYIKEHGKSIFTEDGFKWLDPAAGIGNFPIIVYQRLMKGLKIQLPNEEERRTHILEHMIYMVEISDKSIYILGKIFCGHIYELNIHKGSFLDVKCKYDFTFDIVMGNPPYNPPKTETGSSGNSIWQHFVIKSFYMIKEKGFLLFIHPPGWKKPTDELFDPKKLDILGGEYYKYDKKTGNQSIKQIRQGQVWQVLKDNGVFSFIYTNDQKNKKIKEYINFFPAVDYYVYQKNGAKTTCNTKNIFLGQIEEASGVELNYELNYLPNLITNQTQSILHKITTKEGEKANFNRGIDERKINWNGKIIDWVYDANKKGFQYKKHGINASSENGKTKEDTVGINKIILNYGGGISSYNVKYISTSEEIGVLDKTMYSKVENTTRGKHIERFFNSDIVRFIFLITQYASGAITQNEPLVANSITIPPEEVDDYYAFFDIEKDKTYIEDILTHYYKGSKNPLTKEDEVEDETKTDAKEVNPKKPSIKLNEKIVLVPATEAIEDVSIAIPSPIPKKKRTIKKRPKLILVESSDDMVVPENPIDPNADKIFNPLTNRHVKNTKTNRNKIEKQTLKRGGKSKKKTRKNKDKR
jgi:hypothetical protein